MDFTCSRSCELQIATHHGTPTTAHKHAVATRELPEGRRAARTAAPRSAPLSQDHRRRSVKRAPNRRAAAARADRGSSANRHVLAAAPGSARAVTAPAPPRKGPRGRARAALPAAALGRGAAMAAVTIPTGAPREAASPPPRGARPPAGSVRAAAPRPAGAAGTRLPRVRRHAGTRGRSAPLRSRPPVPLRAGTVYWRPVRAAALRGAGGGAREECWGPVWVLQKGASLATSRDGSAIPKGGFLTGLFHRGGIWTVLSGAETAFFHSFSEKEALFLTKNVWNMDGNNAN